jgi:anthranilate synthase component 1
MNSLEDELNIPDLDLIRPKIILGFSHKTSKLVILTSMLS